MGEPPFEEARRGSMVMVAEVAVTELTVGGLVGLMGRFEAIILIGSL